MKILKIYIHSYLLFQYSSGCLTCVRAHLYRALCDQNKVNILSIIFQTHPASFDSNVEGERTCGSRWFSRYQQSFEMPASPSCLKYKMLSRLLTSICLQRSKVKKKNSWRINIVKNVVRPERSVYLRRDIR